MLIVEREEINFFALQVSENGLMWVTTPATSTIRWH